MVDVGDGFTVGDVDFVWGDANHGSVEGVQAADGGAFVADVGVVVKPGRGEFGEKGSGDWREGVGEGAVDGEGGGENEEDGCGYPRVG